MIASDVFQREPVGSMSHTDIPAQSIENQAAVGISISDLTSFYMAKLKQGGNKKTIQDFSSSIDVALQYFGPDTQISSINREMVRAFMLFLAKLPVRFALSKKTRGRPILEVVEIAEQLNLERSSIPTVNKRLDVLRACLLYTSPSPRDQRGSRMPSSA